MPSNELSAILMIELLSLEQTQTGYQIEVGLTRKSGYEKCILTIDEFTYVQLNVLGPFSGERMRLSLYPKWDPFRKSYYSTLIIMNRTFSETLYFACSEYYVSQLLQLKQQDYSHVEDESVVQTMLPSIEPERKMRNKKSKWIGPVALQFIIFACLVFILPLRMDGHLMDSAEALEDPTLGISAEEISSAPFVPLAQTTSIHSQQIEPSPEPSEPAQEPTQPYDEIELAQDKYVYGLPKGYVALSFDDGPSKYTKEIVDILVEHKVVATFLFIGNKVAHHAESVRYANEHQMSIGSHSWDHSKMTSNGDEQNRIHLMKANQALEQITQSPITVFRPPYGAINNKVAAKVMEQQMSVLLWNRDTEDWKMKNPEDLLQYVRHADPSGGIYLFHEKKITVEALPEIIKYLQEKNMKFVIFK
jgi:peptidoglycan/xylan/chitin deacetylase (PgdA/CDA1 family)